MKTKIDGEVDILAGLLSNPVAAYVLKGIQSLEDQAGKPDVDQFGELAGEPRPLHGNREDRGEDAGDAPERDDSPGASEREDVPGDPRAGDKEIIYPPEQLGAVLPPPTRPPLTLVQGGAAAPSPSKPWVPPEKPEPVRRVTTQPGKYGPTVITEIEPLMWDPFAPLEEQLLIFPESRREEVRAAVKRLPHGPSILNMLEARGCDVFEAFELLGLNDPYAE
jgi:hypothetical protein